MFQTHLGNLDYIYWKVEVIDTLSGVFRSILNPDNALCDSSQVVIIIQQEGKICTLCGCGQFWSVKKKKKKKLTGCLWSNLSQLLTSQARNSIMEKYMWQYELSEGDGQQQWVTKWTSDPSWGTGSCGHGPEKLTYVCPPVLNKCFLSGNSIFTLFFCTLFSNLLMRHTK